MRVRSSPFAASGGGGSSNGMHGAMQPPSQPASSFGNGPAAAQNEFDFEWAPSNSDPSGFGQVGVPPPSSHPQQFQQTAAPVQSKQWQQPPQPPQQHLPQQPQQWQQATPQPNQQWNQQHPAMASSQPSAAFLNAGTVGALAGNMGFNEAIAGAAFNQVASQLQGSGAMRWFPFLFMSLQQLFNVGHSFVIRKLLLLLCPFIKNKQGAPSQWAENGSSPTSSRMGPDGLKDSIEEPDLYIPLMSYVTYVLLYGMQRGSVGEFRPEVLPSTASFAMVLLFLEVGAAKMCFYVSGSAVPVLDLLANCGYKYLPLTFMVLARLVLGKSLIYYLFFAYFAACAAWAVRRFLLHYDSPMRQQYGVPPSPLQSHAILGIAIAQLPLCWLLTPSASS